jgi:hypothetical protein
MMADGVRLPLPSLSGCLSPGESGGRVFRGPATLPLSAGPFLFVPMQKASVRMSWRAALSSRLLHRDNQDAGRAPWGGPAARA